MKCSKCGAELSENVKFCCECGAKVEKESLCPECGAKVSPGAKFCGECGHKILAVDAAKEAESAPTGTEDQFDGEEPAEPVDWDGVVHMSELQHELGDGEVYDVKDALGALSKKAKSGRVLTVDDDEFGKKLTNFCGLFAERTGNEATKPLIQQNAIGIIDWGEKGTGRRAVMITRIGVFYIGSEYPKIIDGEAAGGMIPWKLFYKFATSEGTRWRVSIPEILESDEVDEDVKEALKEPDSNLVMKASLNIKDNYNGLAADDISEFLETLKSILDGDYMIEEE